MGLIYSIFSRYGSNAVKALQGVTDSFRVPIKADQQPARGYFFKYNRNGGDGRKVFQGFVDCLRIAVQSDQKPAWRNLFK